MKDRQGWSHTGESPLKGGLKALVKQLEVVKAEMERERDQKVKTLHTLLKHQVISDPTRQVRKNGNKS